MQNDVKQFTDAEKLRHWLDSVPRGEYNKQKRRLVEECLVSASTLNNWLYGKCRIPDSGKRDINRVTLEVTGTEIFTIAKPGGSSKGVCGESSGLGYLINNTARNVERKITFGGRSAILCAGEGRAMLTVYKSPLLVKLADAISEVGDLRVTEVFCVGEDSAVRMVHSLTPSDILGVVCEAIGKVYDADTSVSYARTESTDEG